MLFWCLFVCLSLSVCVGSYLVRPQRDPFPHDKHSYYRSWNFREKVCILQMVNSASLYKALSCICLSKPLSILIVICQFWPLFSLCLICPNSELITVQISCGRKDLLLEPWIWRKGYVLWWRWSYQRDAFPERSHSFRPHGTKSARTLWFER